MKKSILFFVAFAVALLLAGTNRSFAAVGDEFSSGMLNYSILSEGENWKNGTVSIVSSEYTDEESVTIPSYVIHDSKKYDIVRLDDAAFATLSIARISLPSTISYIGTSCFYACKNLEYIKLSPALSYIGPGAFAYCDKLSDIEYSGYELKFKIQDGIIYTLDMRDIVASVGVSGDVVIPEGVKTIGEFAFEGAVSMSSISLPSTLTSIGDGAFCKCTSITKIFLPENLKEVGYNPFMYCSALTSIKLHEYNPNFVCKKGYLMSPDRKTIISAMAVKGDVEIPSSVKTINEYAFCGNLSVTSISLNPKLKTLGQGSFYGCRNLSFVGFDNTKATLEKGVKIFGNTDYYLEIQVPYSASGRSKYIKKLKSNSPSGTIFSGR